MQKGVKCPLTLTNSSGRKKKERKKRSGEKIVDRVSPEGETYLNVTGLSHMKYHIN